LTEFVAPVQNCSGHRCKNRNPDESIGTARHRTIVEQYQYAGWEEGDVGMEKQTKSMTVQQNLPIIDIISSNMCVYKNRS
jgi:hypothetical protein